MLRRPLPVLPSPRDASIGRMRKLPLHARSLLAHAAAVHPHAAVVSLSASGEQHSSSYAELAQAAARRASAQFGGAA